MITVEKARHILQRHPPLLKDLSLSLRDATGRILAAPVISPSSVPPFHNSAMDGYAFAWKDFTPGSPLPLSGELAAGDDGSAMLKPGTAIRIFTGAMVPPGADTVVMQEKTRVENGLLFIEDAGLQQGGNVRLMGSQTRAGDVVLPAGHLISPGTSGFLASLGVSEVQVRSLPRVAVVVTGNEIVPPGTALNPGQVYECNSYSLLPALQALGITATLQFAPDREDALQAVLEDALNESDVLIVTGGVSVGDYDLVVPTLNRLGVETLFHRIKQKPAKPFYFGSRGAQRVFGMPGNPASVLTSWYAYVQPFITGIDYGQQAILQDRLTRKPGLTQFYKARVQAGQVQLLTGQESYRMDAFAHANALLEIPADISSLEPGSPVHVIMFNP